MKQKINKILSKSLGYHLAKSNNNNVIDLFSSKWFVELNLNTVIDVGANAGQFARSVRRALPNATIISFEPIPAEYKNLVNNFKGDKNFKSFQYALGDKEEVSEFELNEFTPSSSLLEFTKVQKEYYPVTGENKKIEVPVKRLDDVLKNTDMKQNVCLKIDVQGFEDKVILGASNLLEKIAVIYVECSFKQFYKDQPLFEDIYRILSEKGFLFRGVGDQLNAGSKAEPVQIDAIFVNSKMII